MFLFLLLFLFVCAFFLAHMCGHQRLRCICRLQSNTKVEQFKLDDTIPPGAVILEFHMLMS